MNWSRISSLEAWKGVALEATWKIAAARREDSRVEPSWPLDSRALESVDMFWPSTYEWAPSSKWLEPLRYGFTRYVRTKRSSLPQPFEGIVMIQIALGGETHDVAIDYSDLANINQDCARRCSIYFKMQFSREGYPFDNVLPGGFVPNSDDIYRYLPSVRAIADTSSPLFDVYGRFGLEFAGDIRRKACSLLAQQNYFRWEGSLQKKRYSLSLREIARSKICIDLPGNGDFCFRLIDYFAVGACVIAPRHRTTLHIPLEHRKNIVYVQDDLSDLVETCRRYLNDENARRELASNSRSYFDKYLHREQLAAYYLHCCLTRLT